VKIVTILFEVINRYELNWLNSLYEGKGFIEKNNKKG